MGTVNADVTALINEWKNARKELEAITRDENPDITDRHGRVWTWVALDLYSHCNNASHAHMIDSFGLPTQSALDNPNYNLCDTCIAGRTRNVKACNPAWNCSHAMCQSVTS